MAKIPKRLAKLVRERAHYRCEYCQTSEWLSGQECEIDHIIPRVRGGPTSLDNLCLACAACNGFKLDRVNAPDPETGVIVPLYNPRQHAWQTHFTWSEDGTRIIGVTPSGRATVIALRLNRPLAIKARVVWVSIDRHPPKD